MHGAGAESCGLHHMCKQDAQRCCQQSEAYSDHHTCDFYRLSGTGPQQYAVSFFFFILFPPPPTSSLMHSPLLSKNPQGLYRSFCVIFSLVKGFAGNMHLFKPNLKIPGKKNKTKKNILRSRLSALSKILWALLDYRICPETGIHATLVACSHCETVSWKTLCHQQQVRSTASLIRIGRRRDPILLHRIHDVQEGTLT